MDEAHVELTMTSQPRSLVANGGVKHERSVKFLLQTLTDIRPLITEGTDKCCVAPNSSRCYCY